MSKDEWGDLMGEVRLPEMIDSKNFEVIGRLIEGCPGSADVSWDCKPKSLTMRFSRMEDDKSRSIEWASSLADVVAQAPNIIDKLWREVLFHRAALAAVPAVERVTGDHPVCWTSEEMEVYVHGETLGLASSYGRMTPAEARALAAALLAAASEAEGCK